MLDLLVAALRELVPVPDALCLGACPVAAPVCVGPGPDVALCVAAGVVVAVPGNG